jgi:hypothetical protein
MKLKRSAKRRMTTRETKARTTLRKWPAPAPPEDDIDASNSSPKRRLWRSVTASDYAPTRRAAKEAESRRKARETVDATLRAFVATLPPQSARDAKQLARVWNFIRDRPAYQRDYARLRKLLGGHTYWAVCTGEVFVQGVDRDGKLTRVCFSPSPEATRHVTPSARREARAIGARWEVIVGPELPDPGLSAEALPALTASHLLGSGFSISTLPRSDWKSGADPVLAEEVVIRIRPWASFPAVIQAYRDAHRNLLAVGARFEKEWRAVAKATRDPGGSTKGERRSHHPIDEDLIRKVHRLHAHENPDRTHSFPWLARKFGKAVSTMYRYHLLGKERCPDCNPPTK